MCVFIKVNYALTLLNTAICPQDDAVDVFPLAFMNVFFGPGGLPSINLANVNQILSPPVKLNVTVLRLAILLIMRHFLDPPFPIVLRLLLT